MEEKDLIAMQKWVENTALQLGLGLSFIPKEDKIMEEEIPQKYMARRKFYVPEDEANRDYRSNEKDYTGVDYETIFDEE
ncbi:hypothetical protein DRN75_03985 [Nanoarchaeota archaeon]|nr:MAG: hypothetical protein DRN75_03985 [Nanoarchaeota archaeon]